MTDIFFSYTSVDRERVRPIRDALAAQGFDVFWDQQVPAGVDWDSWIRQRLAQCKCAVVFWSATSVASDNVRHEATVAKRQGKLIPVLLEPLTVEQFPMGLYTQQAVNLVGWKSDIEQSEWLKLIRDCQAKLTPLWVQRQIHELEAELLSERAQREGAEAKDKVSQAQIAKEARTRQDLRRERGEAVDEAAALRATVEELSRARAESEASLAALSQRLREAEARLQATAQADGRHFTARQRAKWVFIAAALAAVSFLTCEFLLPERTTAELASSSGFKISSRTEAIGSIIGRYTVVETIDKCERTCEVEKTCKIYTYNRNLKMCYLYSSATLSPSENYDSGVRK